MSVSCPKYVQRLQGSTSLKTGGNYYCNMCGHGFVRSSILCFDCTLVFNFNLNYISVIL